MERKNIFLGGNKMINDLDKIRKNIDALDDAIVDLISKRLALMPAIGKFKKSNDIPFYQPEREEEILRKIVNKVDKKLVNPEHIKNIYKKIMEEAVKIQEKA